MNLLQKAFLRPRKNKNTCSLTIKQIPTWVKSCNINSRFFLFFLFTLPFVSGIFNCGSTKVVNIDIEVSEINIDLPEVINNQKDISEEDCALDTGYDQEKLFDISYDENNLTELPVEFISDSEEILVDSPNYSENSQSELQMESDVIQLDASQDFIGKVCNAASDCPSGMCVEGYQSYVCTDYCDSFLNCPMFYKCKSVQIEETMQNICIPVFSRLCYPCQSSSDCASSLYPSGLPCKMIGKIGETFCISPCYPTCTEGFKCEYLPEYDIQFNKTYFCVPKEPTICKCSEIALKNKAVTSCYQFNQYGNCLGKMNCSENGFG